MHLLHSIRFRLTFWYILTLTVILTASALFAYHYYERTLRDLVDRDLLAIAQQVSDLHVAHLNLKDEQHRCEEFNELTHQRNWDAFVLLRGSNMQPLCTSDNLLIGDLEFGAVAMQQVRWLNPHLETLQFDKDTSLRMISSPIKFNGNLAGVVQVAKDLRPIHQTLGELRLVYTLIGPFSIFWLCLGCWFLADRLVIPIVEMTNAARTINADNLSRRLPSTGHRDELNQMVVAFNQMLERLDNAFRKMRLFSGDASHELRTPLTILRGETEVTLRWAKTPEEFRDMLRSNMEEIDRMERIIENLLTLAKSESGEMVLDIKRFSLSDMILALYMQSKTLAESKKLSVNLRIEVEEELLVLGDELRLRQLFLNLIANGIKYTPEGGALELVLLREGLSARVDVRDSGIGIPVEAQPFIFDRFYRVDKARNRMDGGSGLGLSICKAIAEAHDGRISVTSSPGQGSTFSVLLPIDGPAADKPRATILV
jgi:heavy metal sensor kinase